MGSYRALADGHSWLLHDSTADAVSQPLARYSHTLVISQRWTCPAVQLTHATLQDASDDDNNIRADTVHGEELPGRLPDTLRLLNELTLADSL